MPDPKNNSENSKNILTADHPSAILLNRLVLRCEEIGYGELTCELKIHDGEIKQIDIVQTKERLRIDNTHQ